MIVSWLNPYHWHPAKVERFSLRFSGVFRWIMIVLCLGTVVGFTIGLQASVRDDLALTHNGVPVTATVYEVDKSDQNSREDQYLLTYQFGGQWHAQWVQGLHNEVNDKVTIIIDRTDPLLVALRPVDAATWIGDGVLLLMAVFFGWLGYRFVRMDAAGFRRYTLARFGRA